MTFETYEESGDVVAAAEDTTEDTSEAQVTEVQVTDAEEVDSEEILVLDEVPDPQATLPVWEPTGNVAVDAALEDLHSLAQTELAEHAHIYERVQGSLRATLDGLAADDSA